MLVVVVNELDVVLVEPRILPKYAAKHQILP